MWKVSQTAINIKIPSRKKHIFSLHISLRIPRHKNSMAGNAQRSPPNGISILISGAGIGGLMAALELWRTGKNPLGIIDQVRHSLIIPKIF
jgi:hypothetical protein